MQTILKLVFALVASQRDITSPEYQSLSKRALQPSFQWNFDEYQFNKIGDLETFLPIDDDTLGEFLVKQKGHGGKFNFIQHRIAGNTFDNLQLYSPASRRLRPRCEQGLARLASDVKILH